jgi:anthranilate synthase/aminodeoxychorismate synthase-like glutamine amidotransferase
VGNRVVGKRAVGKRVVVVDNYDSFVYNLFQYLGELGADPVVVRNDAKTIAELRALEPDALVISPGPGRPADAGVSNEAILAFGEAGTPVLGVCLGHQCIGEVFGGEIVRAPEIVHGKPSDISHDGRGVFTGLPDPLTATRYHSLVIEPSSIPTCLAVTAHTPDGLIMGVRHKELPIEGVQFHPESILTGQDGKSLLANFLAGAVSGAGASR